MVAAFLPETYEVPKSGGGSYFKLEDGKNQIRIMTEAVVTGWCYWNKNNKKVYSLTEIKNPSDLGIDKQGKLNKVQHFWLCVVWNYSSGSCQLWEITQGTIQRAIQELYQESAWGHPIAYDIVVKKDSKAPSPSQYYTVNPLPKTPLTPDQQAKYQEFPNKDVKKWLNDAISGKQQGNAESGAPASAPNYAEDLTMSAVDIYKKYRFVSIEDAIGWAVALTGSSDAVVREWAETERQKTLNPDGTPIIDTDPNTGKEKARGYLLPFVEFAKKAAQQAQAASDDDIPF